MPSSDDDSTRPLNPIQASLVVAGCISFIAGVCLGFGGNEPQAVLGGGLVVFAGTCLAAAAIRESISRLRKDD